MKSLIDDIFSEENFIIAMPRITKKSGKTTGSFSKNHDYILVNMVSSGNIKRIESKGIDRLFNIAAVREFNLGERTFENLPNMIITLFVFLLLLMKDTLGTKRKSEVY